MLYKSWRKGSTSSTTTYPTPLHFLSNISTPNPSSTTTNLHYTNPSTTNPTQPILVQSVAQSLKQHRLDQSSDQQVEDMLKASLHQTSISQVSSRMYQEIHKSSPEKHLRVKEEKKLKGKEKIGQVSELDREKEAAKMQGVYKKVSLSRNKPRSVVTQVETTQEEEDLAFEKEMELVREERMGVEEEQMPSFKQPSFNQSLIDRKENVSHLNVSSSLQGVSGLHDVSGLHGASGLHDVSCLHDVSGLHDASQLHASPGLNLSKLNLSISGIKEDSLQEELSMLRERRLEISMLRESRQEEEAKRRRARRVEDVEFTKTTKSPWVITKQGGGYDVEYIPKITLELE